MNDESDLRTFPMRAGRQKSNGFQTCSTLIPIRRE